MISRKKFPPRNFGQLCLNPTLNPSFPHFNSHPNIYTREFNSYVGPRFWSSILGHSLISHKSFVLKTPNLLGGYDFSRLNFYTKSLSIGSDCVRCYSSGKNSDELTEEIQYLDESGSVIYSGKGIRSIEPGLDDHVMVGGLKKPLLNASAIAKIVEVVKRWKWGPELEAQLDKLQFVPNMIHVTQALKLVKNGEGALSLFRWAKRQPWYLLSDECYVLLFDALNESKDFDGIQSLFDEMVQDSSTNGVISATAYNRVIQFLAKADKMEVAFCCFKKIQDSGCKVDTKT